MKTKKILRLPPRWLKIATGNHRALLLCEAQALVALREAAQRATESIALRLQSAALLSTEQTKRLALTLALHAAPQLLADVSRAVLAARRSARAAALARLHVELSAAAKELGFPPPPKPPLSDAAEDQGLAQSAAESYVAAWRAGISLAVLKWAESSEPRPSLSKAIQDSARSLDYRLSRIAATEVSRAYSDEHDEGGHWIVEEHKEARWLPFIVKRWDAILDRGVCEVCRDMDGRYAALGMRFKGGREPGEEHCHCRCIDSLIPLPVHMRGEMIEPDELDERMKREVDRVAA